ncbi:MAG: hypothetical protein II922_07950 [Succinimonas sp.]|nr:hypothetical protein [Succinimonas sp.]
MKETFNFDVFMRDLSGQWSEFNRSMHKITFSQAAPVEDAEIAGMYDEATDNCRYDAGARDFNYRDYIRKSLGGLAAPVSGGRRSLPQSRAQAGDPGREFGGMFVNDPETARDRNQRYGFLAGVDFKKKAVSFLRREARGIVKRHEEGTLEERPVSRSQKDRAVLLGRLFIKLCNLAEVRNEVWKEPFVRYVFGEPAARVFGSPEISLRWEGREVRIRSFDDARDFAGRLFDPGVTGLEVFNVREICSGFMECLLLQALGELLRPLSYDRERAEGLIGACLAYFKRPRNREELLGLTPAWLKNRADLGACLSDAYFLSGMSSFTAGAAAEDPESRQAFFQEFQAAGLKALRWMGNPRVYELVSPEYKSFKAASGLWDPEREEKYGAGEGSSLSVKNAAFRRNIAAFLDFALLRAFIDVSVSYYGLQETPESGIPALRETLSRLPAEQPELYISPGLRRILGEQLGVTYLGHVRYSKAEACIFQAEGHYFALYPRLPGRTGGAYAGNGENSGNDPEDNRNSGSSRSSGVFALLEYASREQALEIMRGLS